MTQLMEAPAQVPARNNGNSNATRQTALAAMASRFAIEPNRLMEVLKATVIKGGGGRQATNEEVAAFIVVANQYGLNPFTREIHAFADSQRGVVPIVGIDGWAHIVNAEPRFDGCDFDEKEGEDGKPISITCSMYVKDRARPVKVTERFVECKRNTAPWNQMPWRMLRHKAFMQAARLALSISGLYDEDEARDIIEGQLAPLAAATPAEPRTRQVLNKLTRGRTEPELVEQHVEQDAASTETTEATVERVDECTGEVTGTESQASTNAEPESSSQPEKPIDSLDDALKQDWGDVRQLLYSTSKQEWGTKQDEFERGLGLHVMSIGKKGKEQTITLAARKNLYHAMKEGRFDFGTGKVTPPAK